MSLRYQQSIFLSIFTLLFLSVCVPNGTTYLGIDASWHQALVMAIDNNFTFGKDFIFNYGPLGFINTGLLPKSISNWFMVVLQAFTLINYLFIINLCFLKSPKNWKWVAAFSVIIFLPWGFISDATFTFFYFQLFWLFYSWRTGKTESLFVLILLTLLIFYIKVNLSIISYVLFYCSLVYFGAIKRFKWLKLGTIILLHLGLTYALSMWLNVELLSYLASSLQIIDAYQDAMSTFILSKQEFLTLFFFELIMAVIALFYVLKHKKAILNHLYIYLLIGFSWLIHFKQAHTAIGHYNIFGYFLLMPLFAVLLYLFVDNKLQKDFGKLFVYVLVIQLISTQIIRFYIGNHSWIGYLKTFPPDAVVSDIETGRFGISKLISLKNPTRFFSAVSKYNYENNFKNADYNKQRALTADVLNEIQNESIDILPYEISYIFFNKLNYNPRPVIQSYQANNDWLTSKNAEKYSSSSAPTYVLGRIEYFREQNPVWMDGKSYLQLFKNYELVDTSLTTVDTLFLFKKVNNNKVTEKTLNKGKYQLNNELEIPKNDQLIILKADVHYSFLGKLARLFFQPPYLNATVTYENGMQETFRLPPPILKSGILINKKITTQSEFAYLNLKKHDKLLEIKNIRFWGNIQRGFESNFSYSFYEIN